MCVAVVLAENGGCVNVDTKAVQGKAPTLPTNRRGGRRGFVGNEASAM